ncbi:MAG: endolytic transglycosylase MltG, partial [Clostridiales bacterium]
RADELGKGVYEIVIMASLVEKEAVVEQDRPLIAGVFYKRLEIGMNLESCATIQFLFDEPKLKLLNSDLKIESPYNFYLHNGLPPAPIAAPGLASLKAAAYPEESEYLFFRARTDGSHRFSKTLAEHESHQPDDQ